MAYEKRDLTKLTDEDLAEPNSWPESWDQLRVQHEWRRRELAVQREVAGLQKSAARSTRYAAFAAAFAAMIAAGSLVLDYFQDPLGVPKHSAKSN